jgi:hypothetical protein
VQFARAHARGFRWYEIMLTLHGKTWFVAPIAVAVALISSAWPSIGVRAQEVNSQYASPRTAAANGVMVILLSEITFEDHASAISDEHTIVECISSAIRAADSTRRIISYDEFRVVVFQDLARKASPRKPEYLGILLRQPAFRARIEPLGIRHIVFVGGATRTSAPKGGAFCGYGDRGGACLALVYWNHRSELSANIVDITGGRTTDTLTSTTYGTAWLAIIGIVPLGMPALTQSSACMDLGSRVARALLSTAK